MAMSKDCLAEVLKTASQCFLKFLSHCVAMVVLMSQASVFMHRHAWTRQQDIQDAKLYRLGDASPYWLI